MYFHAVMEAVGAVGWVEVVAAAVRSGGPHAFATRRSAAALLGLDGFGPGEEGWSPGVEVGVPRCRHHRPGVLAVDGVGPADLTLVATPAGPVPCLGAARCLVQLGSVAGPDLVEQALESALRRGLVRLGGLPPDRSRRPGAGVLRQVLAGRPPGAPPTESALETRFLQLCRRGGIPTPVRQLPLSGGAIRLDAAWPWCRVAAELDGSAAHGEGRRQHDLHRQNRIVTGRWVLLRFTWADVIRRPEETLGIVRAALSLGVAGVQAAHARG